MGVIIGSVLGSAYTAIIGDWLILWLAKRNRGVHKPEHRIIVLAPMAVLGFAMLLLYAFTVEGASSWWGLMMSVSLFSASWVSVLIVSTTFAAEVWPKHPGPALVMVVGSKNILSFCLTFAYTPMVASRGITWAFCVIAGVFAGIFVLGFPVYFLNTKWRRAVSKKEKLGSTTD